MWTDRLCLKNTRYHHLLSNHREGDSFCVRAGTRRVKIQLKFEAVPTTMTVSGNSRTIIHNKCGVGLVLLLALAGGGVGALQTPNVPFFATNTQQQPLKEGRASITTRLPIGKLFESREYIFSTATNVRGYEWTIKETEELLDDLLDASNGLYSPVDMEDEVDESKNHQEPHDYELNQIILVPMEWDQGLLGLGARYDVYDGQQRLVTLCLLFAAMKECFEKLDEKDAVTELADMLNPPKTRK